MKRTVVVVGAAVVLCVLGVLYLSLDAGNKDTPPVGGTACTAEALLCPDGSGVGRSGSQCTFSACPQVPSLVGELEQIGGGFQLILDAEVGGRGYVVPLQTEVSAEIAALVGKRVEVVGRYEVGNTFVVENLTAYEGVEETESVETIEILSRGEVRYGQTVILNEVSVTFERVEEDSRCPSDVTCVSAGTFTALLLLEEGEDQERVLLSIGDDFVFKERTVTIESALPIPESAVSREPSEYVLTVLVE